MRLPVSVLVVTLVLLAGCGDGDGDPSNGSTTPPDQSSEETQQYPDVVEVTVSESGGTYTFDVTISSPYDSPDRYADGWRIKGTDDTVFGEHTLMHDHAGEQPFTRTQSGVEIPDGVDEVIVEGHDQEFGYGGGTKTVPLH